MTNLSTVLIAAGPLPLIPLAVTALVSLVIGMMIKNSVVAKHRKKVLKVENEMLGNHSRILSLEKRISELETENRDLRDRSGNAKPELKVS